MAMSEVESGSAMGVPVAEMLRPMLQMFGMDPDEQSTNIKALAAELKGDAARVKARAQYTPEFVQMFQRMMQQKQMGRAGMPQGIPGNLTPAMARSLLQMVYQ